ncbi:MAG: HAMP domain-containing histidine kinase [Oscillibacter sp.]|nr:HAMP domain-containing histidine kinase [Oscillibacter sp.]
MKLIYRILYRLSVALLIVLGIWGAFFYLTVIDEINDETDDSLEDYSETIIRKALAGQELPSNSNGSNNTYYLTQVSEEYARNNKKIRYSDEMIYIDEKEETEPARILKTIFRDQRENYFELTVSIPTIEKEDLQEAILWWIVFLYITLLLTILLINIWVFYRSMRPLYHLLNWLDHYTIGSSDLPPTSRTKITEFRKLNEAARQSAMRNEQIFQQQKQFIGNAAHEIQTPLAICQNRLEMLINQDNIAEEQLEELIKTHQTLEHIVKLNKSLLFLFKIDNGQFQENQKIKLNDIIIKLTEDFQEAYAYKNIQLTIIEEAYPEIVLNETLAVALISNLLKNAYIHNIPNGSIEIRISSEKLLFSNTGTEETLDENRIFERFYQGKKRQEHSTGLGLSIVHSIARFYHLPIRYFFNGKHNFEIKFHL